MRKNIILASVLFVGVFGLNAQVLAYHHNRHDSSTPRTVSVVRVNKTGPYINRGSAATINGPIVVKKYAPRRRPSAYDYSMSEDWDGYSSVRYYNY